MEKKRKKNKHKQNLRAKSPIIMSSKSRMSLLNNDKHSTIKIHSLNEIPKKNQETKTLPVNTTHIHLPKTQLNFCSNLESTPNTRNLNKSVTDSRIIMNLSPIMSTSLVKTNFKCYKDIFEHKLIAENNFSLDNLNNQNSSSIHNIYKCIDKLETNEIIQEPSNKNNIYDSLILPTNNIKKYESNVNEKAKRCLFEKENKNSTFTLDTEQDSLNISLDILEQVCQMSEMIDSSSTEEIQINDNTNNKKNKLAFFLYGNNSTQLDDTKDEHELLQLALSMEDNLLNETKSKNNLYFEGEFTSLNQLNKKQTTENNKFNICLSDSECKFLDPLEINNIGNTQMCEIADITERLESFDDQWTQQYTNNISNLCNEEKENQFLHDSINSNQRLPSSFLRLCSKDKIIANLNICEEFSTAGGKAIKISDKTLQKVQLMLKDELNESSIVFENKTITSANLCKGFSTAGGKSIKISDKTLQKVQLMLKDEFNDCIVPEDKTITSTNLCKGFSTAGGKSIKVSDKTLQKVQLMLKDEFNDCIVPEDKTITSTNLCKGFSTAGGKSIKVSDKALQKVQLMLKDELNESSFVFEDKTITSANLCKGFSTAGGKSIKVSDKALQKVQLMLKDKFNDCIVPEDKTITSTNLCKGFTTAGGKSIKVADKALQKVQLMLKDELNKLSNISKKKTITSPNICEGFSIVGGIFINEFDKLIKKNHSTNDDVNGIIFDNLLQTTYTSCRNLNERSINTISTVHPNSNSIVFDISKFEKERTLEDLSLIDTVEKFERDENTNKPIMINKRPGSPLYEISHKTRKTIHHRRWENDVLKTSFDVYLAKKLNGPKVSLPKIVGWVLPKTCNIKQFPENVKKYELTKLNVDNALNLKLLWEKYNDDKNKFYNFQDVKSLFLSHHFVDDNLIPNGWIENHFRLIVWKLAATEISFPDYFEHKILNAKNVIHQLLYRYYREIEKCQRSALKKILERDETAAKRIILCVSKVIKTNIVEVYNIELTDGWYSVQGLIDLEMNMLLHKGIVKVGTKLITYNAELIGAGEGIHSLNVHNDVKLKISTNSTRRVRWYVKLGFYKNSSLPIPISLESVLPHGGIIGSLSLVILRKYNMMYLERKKNSKSILRNEKMEAIETEKYKAYQQKSLENISSQIESELIAEIASITKKSTNYFPSIKKEHLDKLSIDELSSIIENSIDPLEIQSLLSHEKLEALKCFKKSEHDRFYNELRIRVDRVFKEKFEHTRKVIPLFKIRVVDEKYASTGYRAAILTIWNPSEDVFTILNKSSEGQCCTVHHLVTNGFINGELQISTIKNTRFDFRGIKNEFAKRDVVLSFKSIWSGTLPLFGELDFVAIVVSNINTNYTSNRIYVSDKEMNIISILFQDDIKNYGCADMMYPGNIISGINIQFRGFNKISSIPILYNTELSSFTTIPKTKHLLNIFDEYKQFLKKIENQDFLKFCESRLDEIYNKNIGGTTTNKEDIKQQYSNPSKSVQRKTYGELPITLVKTNNTSQSENSPVQKRLKLLNTYRKTPSLNIVQTKPPEKKLLSQFKTPTRL